MKEKLEKGDFKVSIAWLVKKYLFFNKTYFDNKLPAFNIFNFRIDNFRNYFGSTTIFFKRKEDGSLESVKDSSVIEISSAFYLNEISYEEVLLHEMIHIYQGHILNEWPDHNDVFEQKVTELKEKGREVPIFENPEDFELREKRKYSKEEIKAFSLLFQDPRIIQEWDEDGEHYIEVVVT